MKQETADKIFAFEILAGLVLIIFFLIFFTGCTIPVQKQGIEINTSHEFAIVNSNGTCLVYDKSVQEITNCTILK